MDKNYTEIQSKAKHIAKLVERKIFKLSVINLIKPFFSKLLIKCIFFTQFKYIFQFDL